MKLIIGIINKEDAASTTKALNAAGYYVTKLAATGGFLKRGNITILIGTDEEKVPAALEIIDQNAKKRTEKENAASAKALEEPRDKTTMEGVIGGATVFVVEVDRFEKI
ncbi:cyclic-di-AMP receptor [Beduini massiliensis]|uniref:cyclic-di-AMP receptor n=1 Tax=Beduini massiliensis TaxID=1585974 RepID=UPI00059A9947|nr:cyclic-di-AMP receptor [Beduini massiliensis]